MQREAPARGRTVEVAIQSLQPGWPGLQCEQLLPGPGANGNAVGDGVADQVIQWAGFREVGKPRVLHVALDQALFLRCAIEAPGDVFDEGLQILCAWLWHLPEHRRPGLIDHVHAIEEQHVEVDVQVQRGPEALDQCHGAGVADGAGKSDTLQPVAWDRASDLRRRSGSGA
jgi:hypothetical protein